MRRPVRYGRYHHGDLRTALVAAAIEVIGERGVRNFSLAEASRRVGVAASAPYAHFADRDELLAAIAVQGLELLADHLLPALGESGDAAGRLAAMTRGYVRFAVTHRPLFEVLYQAGLDKGDYPQVAAAQQLVDGAFAGCVHDLAPGDETLARDLAEAIEAIARGYAQLLPGNGATTEEAAERAARAAHALIESRHLLARPGTPAEPSRPPARPSPEAAEPRPELAEPRPN
jgi:AcrR family transcriptional regulator